MLRTISAAVVLAGLVCASVPAFAQDRDVERQVVYIGDVDRYSEEGANIILNRIERASINVCDARRGIRPVVEAGEARACAVDAREDAVSQVNSSVVTAMYYGYEPQVIVSENDDYGDTIIVKKPV